MAQVLVVQKNYTLAIKKYHIALQALLKRMENQLNSHSSSTTEQKEKPNEQYHIPTVLRIIDYNSLLAHLHSELGDCYFAINELKAAFKQYDYALKELHVTGKSSLKAQIVNRIGDCYYQLNDTSKARKLYRLAMKYTEPTDEIRQTIVDNIRIANDKMNCFSTAIERMSSFTSINSVSELEEKFKKDQAPSPCISPVSCRHNIARQKVYEYGSKMVVDRKDHSQMAYQVLPDMRSKQGKTQNNDYQYLRPGSPTLKPSLFSQERTKSVEKIAKILHTKTVAFVTEIASDDKNSDVNSCDSNKQSAQIISDCNLKIGSGIRPGRMLIKHSTTMWLHDQQEKKTT